jgi:hypothetical protein
MMIAVVGSMTAAQRGQRALLGAAIRADIVKSDKQSERGCGYGLLFAASQQGNVRAILREAHVNVRRYTQDEWSML